MICKICGVNETDNPDGICDDCKFSIISNDVSPDFNYVMTPCKFLVDKISFKSAFRKMSNKFN